MSQQENNNDLFWEGRSIIKERLENRGNLSDDFLKGFREAVAEFIGRQINQPTADVLDTMIKNKCFYVTIEIKKFFKVKIPAFDGEEARYIGDSMPPEVVERDGVLEKAHTHVACVTEAKDFPL